MVASKPDSDSEVCAEAFLLVWRDGLASLCVLDVRVASSSAAVRVC